METLINTLLALALLGIAWVDYKTHLIPNKLLLLILIVFIPLRLTHHPLPLIEYGTGAIIGFLAILAIYLLTKFASQKEVFGLGDVKLMFVIGLIIGTNEVLWSIAYAFMLGALSSIVLLALKRVSKNEQIAFGPFLALGTIITIFL